MVTGSVPGVDDPTSSGAAVADRAGVWTVVVAAGGGTRFGGAKQYAALGGRRVLDWSLDVSRASSEGVVLVVPEASVETPEPLADVVVAGAATRSGSVRAGLAAVPDAAEIVVVHDGARPAASAALFAAVVAAVRAGADAAVPGVPLVDSIRTVDGAAVDRDGLVAVQTPQAFRAATLRSAHAGEADASDDATLVEVAGGSVVVVPGDPTNVKVTHPGDLDRLAHDLADAPADLRAVR